jgi:hypothetical protein
VGYSKFYSRSHNAVIRVYDAAGSVIETHEHSVISKSRKRRFYVEISKEVPCSLVLT